MLLVIRRELRIPVLLLGVLLCPGARIFGFILVARMPSDASASVTFFNVDNDENDPLLYLPEGFVKKTEGRGLVVPSWAPKVAILKHPSTGAFLSHCGWNSTLESIAHDVPLIAWPLYAEQRMNATILANEVSVAIKFPIVPGEELISRKEIEKVVRIVMEGEKGKAMRRKGKELKESAKIALSKGLENVRNLLLPSHAYECT